MQDFGKTLHDVAKWECSLRGRLPNAAKRLQINGVRLDRVKLHRWLKFTEKQSLACDVTNHCSKCTTPQQKHSVIKSY